MCIVIDANALSGVFNEKSKEHHEFAPVRSWILEGKGKLVFGGTRYKRELSKASRYLGLVNELQRMRKAVEVCEEDVDRRQQQIERVLQHRDLDDSHIVAIVIVSRCKLICSCDRRAHRFFKTKTLYPKRFKRPKIYTGFSCKHLLCDENIVGVCC